MKKIFFVLLALASISAAYKSGEWKFSVNQYDLRTATTTATGKANSFPITTTLSVVCRPGPNGALSIDYKVHDIDKTEGFNFDSFEGPYAPAYSKKLMAINVISTGKIIKIKTAVAGYYAAHNTFAFSASAMNTEKSDIRTIAESLMKGAKSIRVTVHDMNKPTITIKTKFPASNAKPVIEKTITGCLKN